MRYELICWQWVSNLRMPQQYGESTKKSGRNARVTRMWLRWRNKITTASTNITARINVCKVIDRCSTLCNNISRWLKTHLLIVWLCSVINYTRRALGGAHLPPTKLFPRVAVNKTILKPRITAAMGAQYLYVGFSRRNKTLHCSAYDIGESNPVPASAL